MTIRAVIFDMDGVVLDSEPIYRRCWQRAAAELGHQITDEMYTRVLGMTDDESEKILVSLLGKDFPVAEFRERWPSYWLADVRQDPIPCKPGFSDLLDFLAARRIPRAIATSTEREKASLSLGDLKERFDAMVTGDEIEKSKPAPDIFLAAAERLGVPARDCWVIEDSEAGVRAADAAGMKAVIVPDLMEPSQDILGLVECVCRSLKEVQQVLEKQLNEADSRSRTQELDRR